MFKIKAISKKSKARIGQLKTSHGIVESPFFLPIATQAAVRNLTPEELKIMRAQIILSNTYHLFLRPGIKVIEKSGDLHKFMNWTGPILTDSGGYQVFSLAKARKIKPGGVKFKSEIDGKEFFLTPQKAIKIQQALGSDIMMALDVLVGYPYTYKEAEGATRLTLRWAKKCKEEQLKSKRVKQLLFGIVQGGVYKDLRHWCAEELTRMDFDGYAIGGLTVGEPVQKAFAIIRFLTNYLPINKPRYLMGAGKPEQIVRAVKYGIDMFDCVLPTRHGRHGDIFIWKTRPADFFKKRKFYEILHITNAKFKDDVRPLDSRCSCYACQNFSRSYLHHLFRTHEPLALRLATIHNLSFYLDLMKEIKKAIKNGYL